jgi:hypothetical protein
MKETSILGATGRFVLDAKSNITGKAPSRSRMIADFEKLEWV